MNYMKLPIIVVEKMTNDIGIYDTVQEAEQDLEPVDVRNGEYILYDSEGRVLDAVVVSRCKSALGIITYQVENVQLREREPEALHQDELRNQLVQYLQCVGKEEEIDYLQSLSLNDLISRAVGFSGKKSTQIGLLA